MRPRIWRDRSPGETPKGKAVKYLWEDPENQAFRRGVIGRGLVIGKERFAAGCT